VTELLPTLGTEIDILLVKATNVRQSVATLMTAMRNVIILHESILSQQISIASKRDSTVMIAIAVGTSLFLPLTAMASIFAMPFLPSNVQPGNRVKGRPLLVY
jgi:Mg2+ and Co2+ transporter CorA